MAATPSTLPLRDEAKHGPCHLTARSHDHSLPGPRTGNGGRGVSHRAPEWGCYWDGCLLMAHESMPDDRAIAIHTAPAAPGEVAAVALWWRAGRLHEAPTEAGAAHLLEHLVCDALPRGRVAHWGGAVNGQSGREWTVWHALLPAALAPEFIAELSAALTAPLPDAATIAQEARVLAAERSGTRSRDDWELAALRAAFGDHPLARPLAVAPGIGRERLERFRARLLCPSRLILTAAGPVDAAALRAAAAPLAGCSERPTPEPAPPPLPTIPCHAAIDAVGGSLWLLPFSPAEAPAVAALADLLAHPLLGRLPRRLRQLPEPGYALHSEIEYAAGIGLWWLWLDQSRAAPVLAAEIETCLERGFDAAEWAEVAALHAARATLTGADLTGRLAVLSGARPEPAAAMPEATTLTATLAECWGRRVSLGL